MAEEDVPLSDRSAAAFAKLRASASEITTVSDQLSESIRAVERTFNRLKIRVACWTMISEQRRDDGGDYFKREYLGYREHGKEWRILLSVVEGFDGDPMGSDDSEWLFDEAPQYLRGKAIDYLPDLVEALTTTVDKTTERLRKKVEPAQAIAKASGIVMVKRKVTR